jgi:hypothetical protein
MFGGVSQHAIVDVATVPGMVDFKHTLLVPHEQECPVVTDYKFLILGSLVWFEPIRWCAKLRVNDLIEFADDTVSDIGIERAEIIACPWCQPIVPLLSSLIQELLADLVARNEFSTPCLMTAFEECFEC